MPDRPLLGCPVGWADGSPARQRHLVHPLRHATVGPGPHPLGSVAGRRARVPRRRPPLDAEPDHRLSAAVPAARTHRARQARCCAQGLPRRPARRRARRCRDRSADVTVHPRHPPAARAGRRSSADRRGCRPSTAARRRVLRRARATSKPPAAPFASPSPDVRRPRPRKPARPANRSERPNGCVRRRLRERPVHRPRTAASATKSRTPSCRWSAVPSCSKRRAPATACSPLARRRVR